MAGVSTREEAPIYAAPARAVGGGWLRRGHGVAPGRAAATDSRPRGPARGPASGLTGRRAECVMLDGFLTAVRTGEADRRTGAIARSPG